jgi:hypothetical protein
MVRRALSLAVLAGAVLFAQRVRADDAPADTVPSAGHRPRVHHAAVASTPAHDPLRIAADVEFPELMKELDLVYRKADGKIVSTPMLRGGEGFVAEIPAEDIVLGVAYAIELEQLDGTRTAAFASRQHLHVVEVIDDYMNMHERAVYDRMGGKRSVAQFSGDYVRFGRTTGVGSLPCNGQGGCPPGKTKTPEVLDEYWRSEGSYTYRPFRTVEEFSLKAGVLRGNSLVETKTYSPSKYSVGANYAAPTVTLRIADSLHLESELLTSITEVGFSLGGGNTVTIGDLYGTGLQFGWEAIGFNQSYFGSRFFTKMNVSVVQHLVLSPAVEVTDMPHAENFGLRLLGEAKVSIGHSVQIGLRGGYQARRSVSGGPSFGGTLGVAF